MKCSASVVDPIVVTALLLMLTVDWDIKPYYT